MITVILSFVSVSVALGLNAVVSGYTCNRTPNLVVFVSQRFCVPTHVCRLP